MVIDSSAVLAVLLGEEDAPFYANAIEEADDPHMSTVSVLEVTLAIGARKREQGLTVLARFLEKSRIRIVGFDVEQPQRAKDAWWTYGKGRHAAALNLGDCHSYALAQTSGKMLLYKGYDFLRTDVRGVEPT